MSPHRLLATLALASVLLACFGVAMGSTGWQWPWALSGSDASLEAQILWDVRLPRALGAWALGALLGLSGALSQGLFRNPLAEPYLLGSASGATLGMALALVAFGGSALSEAWLQRLGLSGAAFLGAVAGVMLTMALASGMQHTVRLLLAGVVVGVVLSAIKELLVLANPAVLQSLQAFALGTTAMVGWQAVQLLLLALVPCAVMGMALARGLDALSLGEDSARSLGVPVGALRGTLVAVIALATGCAVAQAGLIAFVGLMAPHVVRALVQVPHRWLCALSMATGGVLLLASDLVARSLLSPQELPVGVVTSLLGGGYLLWILQSHGRFAPAGHGRTR